jgi:hypothetical protein
LLLGNPAFVGDSPCISVVSLLVTVVDVFPDFIGADTVVIVSVFVPFGFSCAFFILASWIIVSRVTIRHC